MKYSTKLPVFALFLSILAFVSCQKDVVTSNEAEQFTSAKTADWVYKADYESYQVPADKAKAKINQVVEALRTNNLQVRSATTLPIAEAVWDIEALSNASQAQANWHYKQLARVQSYIPLTTTTENGQKRVSMQEISAKLASAVASIQQAESNTGFPSANRETIYADVVPYEDGRGNVVLELNIGVGTDPEGCPTCPVPNSDPVAPSGCETTDSWSTKFRRGICNTPPMAGGIDASDVIQSMVTYSAATVGESNCQTIMGQVIPPNNTGYGYWINVSISPTFTPENLPNPNFQFGMPEYTRFLLFKSNQSAFGGYISCLDPLQLQFFKGNVEKIIVDHRNANSGGFWTNRYFVDCDVSPQVIVNGTDNMRHFLTFKVGTIVY